MPTAGVYKDCLALARIWLGLDLVGAGAAVAAAAAAEGSFARVWPPNGTLTAIGFCCVVCGRGRCCSE